MSDPYAEIAQADPYEGIGTHVDAAPPAKAAPSQSGSSFGDFLKTTASAAIRAPIKVLSGPPLMAMDLGVAARNILGNATNSLLGRPATPNYQMPSQMFNQALDQVTVAPQGAVAKGAEIASTMVLGAGLPAPNMNSGLTPMQQIKDIAGISRAPAMTSSIPNAFSVQSAVQQTRNQVLAKAQNEGYVVPPASNNPTFMNRLLEGISGKLKLQQEAAGRNQSVTDSLAARALGQNPESPLTQGALSAIRSDASAAGYAPLREIGDIPTDPKFLSDLKGLTQAAQNASRSFPGIQPQSPINTVADALAQPKFNSSDGIDAMSFLRSQADDAFRSGNGTLGSQYKAASKAIEDMIERHLSNDPESAGLLQSFRDARQLMAQTYTAGKALVGDTGSSNALKYAQELARNKPLVGDQRTIASFASQFRKASAFQTESMPSISPLDAYGSAITSAASHSAAPFMVPLTRVGIREYLLSQAGQARAIPQAFKPPETLGLSGGLAGLSSQISTFMSQ